MCECLDNWGLVQLISFSLLSRFINCRERFRLYAVEGAREAYSSKDAMDWGTYFHELIELHAKHPHLSAQGIFKKCTKTLGQESKAIAQTVFIEYMEHYEERYSYAAQELEFRVPYTLPGGQIVYLVGKTDEVIFSPDQPGTLWIQENKTKQYIDEHKIESSIPHDLQTLMYAICVQQVLKKETVVSSGQRKGCI